MYSRLPQTVNDRFDVVTFDPRGIGTSRPIDCVDDAFLDQSSGHRPGPDHRGATRRRCTTTTRAFAAGCMQRTGAYAGQVGTRNVARDLEAIRIALGDPQLTYLGYSYGTVVGATYAQMFPASVGRLVLDGPPDYWISARDYAYRQGKGFMDALERRSSTGVNRPDVRWPPQAHPRDQLNQLIARVDQQPLPAVVHDRRRHPRRRAHAGLLENGGALNALRPLAGWPLLADALSEAVNTGSAPSLLAYSDQYLGRAPDGHWDPLVEANSVITCVDRPSKATPTQRSELADVARLPGAVPAVGRLVRHRVVRRHAQAGQGRQARRRPGARHRRRSW